MQHAREKEAKCTKITHQCECKWCRQDDIFQWTESEGANETRLLQNRVKKGELVI